MCIISPFPLPSPLAILKRNLETLLLHLLLGSSNSGVGIGVLETATLLAVLERGGLGGADALALAVVGAAGRVAVGVGDAAAGDELVTLAVADVLGSGVVGGHGCQGSDGDCN